MQGRMSPYVSPAGVKFPATTCKAFVMQQRNCKDTVTVQVHSTKTSLEILLDGQLVAFDTRANQPKRTVVHNGASIAIYSHRDVRVTFTSGFSFQFDFVDLHLVNLKFFGDRRWKGKTKGLLGAYDGNRNNDLTAPDGTVFPLSSNSRRLHEFGMTWIIKGEESLFTYPSGKTYKDFRDVDFEPIFELPDIDTLPPEAVEACRGSVECLFDLLVTGDSDLAGSTRNAVDQFEEIVNSFDTACTRPDAPRNGFYEATNFREGSTVRLVCNRDFYEVIGNDEITCVRDENGTLSWNTEFGECYNECERDNKWDQYLCEIGIGIWIY